MTREESDQLAGRLKEAFERLASTDLTSEERGTLHRRLIAISDASKHDTTRAAERLDRWMADLDAR